MLVSVDSLDTKSFVATWRCNTDVTVCVLSPLFGNASFAIYTPRQVVLLSLTPLFFFNSALSLTASHLSVDQVTAPLRHIDDGLTQDRVVFSPVRCY